MTYAGGWYWGWYSFTICIGSLGNSMEYIPASSRATPNRMGLLIRHPGGQSCHSDRCYQNAELTKKEKHNSELGTEQSRIEAGGWLARKQLCRKGAAVPVHERLTGNQHSVVAATATCGWGCSSERGAAAPTEPGDVSVLPKRYWENCVHSGTHRQEKGHRSKSGRKVQHGLGTEAHDI